MFLRQSTVGREPLAIAMSGVRMGERLLQIGMDAPAVSSLLAAKPGLSGQSSMVVADEATAAQARRAVEQTGALVDIGVHAFRCPSVRGRFIRPCRGPQPEWTTGKPDVQRFERPQRVPTRSSLGRQGDRARKGRCDRTDSALSVPDRSQSVRGDSSRSRGRRLPGGSHTWRPGRLSFL